MSADAQGRVEPVCSTCTHYCDAGFLRGYCHGPDACGVDRAGLPVVNYDETCERWAPVPATAKGGEG